MKVFFALIICLNINHAFSQDFTDLKAGDFSISQATAELISAEPICPQTAGGVSCMANGTKVTIKVTLNGCVDNFGGHFTNFEILNGRGIIYVGAINISNHASLSTRCIKMPTRKISVVIPFYGEVEVVNVNYNGSIKHQR
jgi:hypothetical protein